VILTVTVEPLVILVTKGDQKSVVTVEIKVVINIRGFSYEVPVSFVKF
jgi:hypothetical protein